MLPDPGWVEAPAASEQELQRVAGDPPPATTYLEFV
jgi:hypothetical protein